MDFTPGLGNQAWKNGNKRRSCSQNRGQNHNPALVWQGPLMLCCTPNAGSSGCGVLPLVSLSALPQTLGMAATSSFARNVFLVLRFPLLVP